MTVYPRQKLYDINHSGFLGATIRGLLNDGEDGGFVPRFAEFLGEDPRHLLPLSRGRLSLYLAVRGRVSGERNEVIMSPFTIFDMVNMSLCGGGVPVFVDSEPGTPHLSLAGIKRSLTDRTALVVVTHYHTVNPEIAEIAAFLRERGVALLEDCAISLGGRLNGRHVGTFGDYGLFSFGLFKFIATYFGGTMWIRDPEERRQFEEEMAGWPNMTASDLAPYAKKGIKFSTLTSPLLFSYLTFPVFKFGYLNEIEFIKKNAVNDPSPHQVTVLPEHYRRRPSSFQVRDWARQLAAIPRARAERLVRAEIYQQHFSGSNSIVHTVQTNLEADCYLNFPVNVANQDRVIATLMRQGFDVSPYFYRDCSSLECFSSYAADLPNVAEFARNMVVLPTYPDLPIDYVNRLADAVVAAAGSDA